MTYNFRHDRFGAKRDSGANQQYGTVSVHIVDGDFPGCYGDDASDGHTRNDMSANEARKLERSRPMRQTRLLR